MMEQYGKSEMMDVLEDVKYLNSLDIEDTVAARAAFVRERLEKEE